MLPKTKLIILSSAMLALIVITYREIQHNREKIILKNLIIKCEKTDRVIVKYVDVKFKYDFSHLNQKTQVVSGPIQDDEALLLYGMVKTIRPKTIVEFGFFRGDSALNFLKALDTDAKMFSFDVKLYNPEAKALSDPRFKFTLKSQTDFDPIDIDNRAIDFAYLDAGHELSIQTSLFPRLIKQMSPNGIIIVHDTGLHSFEITDGHCSCDFQNLCGVHHQLDERTFVNWIRINYPEYDFVNMHSFSEYRHGLTVIQRKYNLSTEFTDKSKCKYVKPN